tara:strand:+ start:1401 stop:1991 length:591 start_codon:yes stop_codon:yes gene_type:complete
MTKSLVIKVLIGLLILALTFFFYFKLSKEEEKVSQSEPSVVEDLDTTTNIINDVNYSSKDAKGNEYLLYANEGQIDINNSKIIFLTKVKAVIKMVDGQKIKIKSDFGKYNINNNDTIFSKNVSINYRTNEINSDYVDFSLIRNLLIISKNVVYSNQKNILKADVVEIDIVSKNTKIFMYDEKKKVKIKSINIYGDN